MKSTLQAGLCVQEKDMTVVPSHDGVGGVTFAPDLCPIPLTQRPPSADWVLELLVPALLFEIDKEALFFITVTHHRHGVVLHRDFGQSDQSAARGQAAFSAAGRAAGRRNVRHT